MLTKLPGRVKSFGSVLKNADQDTFSPASVGSTRSARKIAIARNFKFGFALENEKTTDYVSEKVFEFLEAGVVPVYVGAPYVDQFLPCASKCIIKAEDFASEQDLADYLLYLDRNLTAYAEFLTWKALPPRPAFLAQMKICSQTFGLSILHVV